MLPLLSLVMVSAQIEANDYRSGQTWLCRPDRQDACTVDVSVSRIEKGGKMRVEKAQRAAQSNVDCFYIYPTTSLDDAPNSDMTPDKAEFDRVAAQFAAFSSVCRTYAPLYRQVTLTALRARLNGKPLQSDSERGYRDVRDAWRSYLTHDNGGRPFVLIGHSQGSDVLKRLIAEEIDGKPAQRKLLSAMLPGASLQVPIGKDIGGDFKHIPLCRSAAQTGCALSWSSYRDTVPPPGNALFGISKQPGMEAACTNPARLAGGSATLDSVFGFPWWRGGVGVFAKPEGSWQIGGKQIPTRFARVPGRLSGECVRGGNAHYFSVHVNGAPQTAFDHEITGKANVGDDAYPDWGFHVIDIAIVQGDMLRLVTSQYKAWRKQPH